MVISFMANMPRNYQTFGRWLGAMLLILLGATMLNPHLTWAEWQTIGDRLPYILIGNQAGWQIKGGFALNLFISVTAMAISTVLGGLVGLGLIARAPWFRYPAWIFTQFFRNSPWLVILYIIFYLLPFQTQWGGLILNFSSTFKAIVGLSLVVAANIAEIVRGAMVSIPSGQWESARAMGYSQGQILRLVIFPQALRRMIPPWMNWYAILTMGTTLTNLIGVPEGLTAVRQILELEGERLAIPLYGILMGLFFLYCYPLARWTRKLEQKLIV